MARFLILALANTAAMVAAGSAHAGDVTWSIGISAPGVTTVVSNAPFHRVEPVHEVAPVHAPAPVYATAPVDYVPPPRVFGPPQVPYPLPLVDDRPVPRVIVQPPVVVGVRPVPVVYAPVPHWVAGGDRPDWRPDWRVDWRRDERRYGHARRDRDAR